MKDVDVGQAVPKKRLSFFGKILGRRRWSNNPEPKNLKIVKMIKLIPNTAPRLFLPNHLNLMALMILLLAASTTGIAQETKPIFLPSLSTAGNPRLPGKFVWADLVTDNVAAAQKFYG